MRGYKDIYWHQYIYVHAIIEQDNMKDVQCDKTNVTCGADVVESMLAMFVLTVR